MQRGEANGQHRTGRFLLDEAGKIREIDAASALLLGIDSAELVGRSFRTFVCRAMKPTFSLLLEEVAAGAERRTLALELTRIGLVRLSLSARRSDARGVVAGGFSAAAHVLALSESDKLFRSLAENTCDAVARFDRSCVTST